MIREETLVPVGPCGATILVAGRKCNAQLRRGCQWSGLIRKRVVTAACKSGVISVLHIHFDFPVGAVARLVRGDIAYGVLAAQLFGDLIEGLLQIFLAV